MKRMKQWMHWVLALVLLVMSLSVPAAAAETITVNVTNTPVRGQRGAGKDRLAAGALYGRAGRMGQYRHEACLSAGVFEGRCV